MVSKGKISFAGNRKVYFLYFESTTIHAAGATTKKVFFTSLVQIASMTKVCVCSGPAFYYVVLLGILELPHLRSTVKHNQQNSIHLCPKN